MASARTRSARGRPPLPTALVLLLIAVLLGLGGWQLVRRSAKLALIARVEARVQAPPGPLPPRAHWSAISAAQDEYRHVAVEGVWLPGQSTLVAGASVLGSGWWQLLPLRLDDGTLVLVNRGFLTVPVDGTPDLREAPQRVRITGLLRLSEPGGRLFRRNDPAAGHWYSRDVAAIARARGLGPTAPFFIDADAPGGGPDLLLSAASADDGERLPERGRSPVPRGGLTWVAFPNNHRVYALTWFGLAGLLALNGLRVMREGARQVRPARSEEAHAQTGSAACGGDVRD